ncbi:hypothetical protein RR48_05450 [Papilio machaon]|uniref:Uncharacterized protein n=1 Tax=Papilio machaon TaxID=76193 RepID=A0A0N1PHS3_PAPMA|nr:hypothetical protein RR48_05450 [Papilio machaon]
MTLEHFSQKLVKTHSSSDVTAARGNILEDDVTRVAQWSHAEVEADPRELKDQVDLLVSGSELWRGFACAQDGDEAEVRTDSPGHKPQEQALLGIEELEGSLLSLTPSIWLVVSPLSSKSCLVVSGVERSANSRGYKWLIDRVNTSPDGIVTLATLICPSEPGITAEMCPIFQVALF